MLALMSSKRASTESVYDEDVEVPDYRELVQSAFPDWTEEDVEETVLELDDRHHSGIDIVTD